MLSEEAYTSRLAGRGISESQALYYDRAIRLGKVFVAVCQGKRIKILLAFKAHTPRRSRGATARSLSLFIEGTPASETHSCRNPLHEEGCAVAPRERRGV